MRRAFNELSEAGGRWRIAMLKSSHDLDVGNGPLKGYMVCLLP